jgi:heme oxygenase (biliverdin-IX-beta and delta-forming)
MADVMALLRDETNTQHGSLEQNLPWQQICANQDRYVGMLARFYGFYRVWEPAAEAQLQNHAREFMQLRRKTSLLGRDLRWFGWGDKEFASLLRISSERLPLEGHAMTLGSYYVLEGSTLGGQILSRALERQLGLQNGNGYSYFRSYGPGVREAWAEFGDLLSSQLASEADVSAAVTGARTTFEVLNEWLTGQ